MVRNYNEHVVYKQNLESFDYFVRYSACFYFKDTRFFTTGVPFGAGIKPENLATLLNYLLFKT